LQGHNLITELARISQRTRTQRSRGRQRHLRPREHGRRQRDDLRLQQVHREELPRGNHHQGRDRRGQMQIGPVQFCQKVLIQFFHFLHDLFKLHLKSWILSFSSSLLNIFLEHTHYLIHKLLFTLLLPTSKYPNYYSFHW